MKKEISTAQKGLTYDLADSIMHKGNPLIIQTKVQTTITENFKKMAI